MPKAFNATSAPTHRKKALLQLEPSIYEPHSNETQIRRLCSVAKSKVVLLSLLQEQFHNSARVESGEKQEVYGQWSVARRALHTETAADASAMQHRVPRARSSSTRTATMHRTIARSALVKLPPK